MARTIRVYNVSAFKKMIGTSKLIIKKSSTSDYFYAANDSGIKVAGVSPDAIEAIKNKTPIVVLELEELGDTWYLIVPQRESSNSESIAEL